ncbi:MAG: CotH kinase family protein [Bacteroidota bacterium]
MILVLFLFSCEREIAEEPYEEPLFDVETGISTIPYIVIDTKGIGILNEPKISAEMKIYIQKVEIQSVNIGIEYRGSTSFRLSDKKSFGIETWDAEGNDLDVAILDFPAEEDFILMGHIVNLDQGYIFDRTLMYHHLGYQLFRKMGRYASRSKFVELEINGTYQGVYLLMEKLKRDKNRIDISALSSLDNDPEVITGGYILKIDKTAGGDVSIDQPLEYFEHNWEDDARYTADNSFRSQYDINGNLLQFEPYDAPYHPNQYLETYFLYEYPKAEEITDDQKTYIRKYIHDFETALLTDDFTTGIRTYTDYIDLSSFVDFFIINEVCRNVDGYRLSTYLYKDRGGRLNMGPVWDLNIGFDSGDRVPFDDWVINYNNFVSMDAWMMPFWWPRLMDDPIFRSALKLRWSELRSGVLSTSEILNTVDQNARHLQNNSAVSRNYAIWDAGLGVDYNASIESLKSYLEERTQWMDGEISSF